VEFALEGRQVDQQAAQAITDQAATMSTSGRATPQVDDRSLAAVVAAFGAGDAGVIEKFDHPPAVAFGDLFERTSLVLAVCSPVDTRRQIARRLCADFMR
jgi:hypothetical protein